MLQDADIRCELREKQLIRIRDVYGRIYLVRHGDLQNHNRYQFQVPLYSPSGKKLSDMPKGLRPDAVTIHRENIAERLDP